MPGEALRAEAMNAIVSWIALRDRRGTMASTRMPTHAAPKRINMGASAP